MTDERLAELERLCEFPNTEPWTVMGPAEHSGMCYVMTPRRQLVIGNDPNSLEIAEFIVAARTALPELLAEVRQLRAGMEAERDF